MRYVLLLTNEADEIASWEALPEEEQKRRREAEIPKWNELFAYMQERGAWVDGLELQVPGEARTVRVRDGETVVTDGPYAETKEQIGGIFLVEAENLDEAIDLATRVPVAAKASVEIRPLAQ
jgi:hypothetical protein